MKNENELINYCRNLSYSFYDSEDDRNDLIQDTLLKIYSNIDKFDGKNLKGWCATIMKNTFINKYRRSVNHGEVLIEDFYENYENYDKEICSAVQLDYLNIEDIYIQIEKLKKVEIACIKLRLKGYKYDHIAEILEIPVGTVKSSIYSARMKLMKLIK